ncbi:Hypothetical predicted protein [Mytilus galloprovincialis]|uniref:Ig-like domain-containing protein n=1 Tax=Mytilus galloprovincialis TaxID=29158 RepID=A0A8B6EZS7_MYTGA|nr:Hypothetical predicted protein [Mytilus galloprovincialis]
MSGSLQRRLYRKLGVYLIVLHLLTYDVTVAGEGVAWSLQTNPAVFGKDIVLECKLPSSTCCDRYTRRWLGGKNLHLLIMDGTSSEPDKYSELFDKETRSSKLTIHRLDSKDVNIPYQCIYGFSKDVKILNMTEDRFEYYPVEPIYVNITVDNGNVLQVNAALKPVFPQPKCNASIDEGDISQSLRVSKIMKDLFYEVIIHIRYTFTSSICANLLNITCQIGTFMLEIKRNITCRSDSPVNGEHRNRKNMQEYSNVT